MTRSTALVSALEYLLLCAWAGGAWFAGLVAAPRLFSLLPSGQAGTVAGMLFTAVFWLSLPALGLCLARIVSARESTRWRLDAALAVTALTFSLVNELALHSWIAAMRDGAPGRDEWFGVAHGLSSLLFLANCVLAAVILLRRR